jgi:hypothetical protein
MMEFVFYILGNPLIMKHNNLTIFIILFQLLSIERKFIFNFGFEFF